MVNNRWARLSQNEKAELLGIYTSMGYNDLASIIAHYNSCGGKLKADGGPVTNTAQYKSDDYLYNPPVNVGAPIEVPLRYKPLPDYGDYVPQRTTGMLEDIPIEIGLETPQRGYGVLMPDAPSAVPTLDARQDAARRIMAVENSKNNVNGGYDAKTGRWYPHKSHEGGADTIAYGIKLSNGTPEAALALKQGYLTDEQAESAVDTLVQKYYNDAKKVYDKRFGEGEWDKLSDKSQSILVDYSYNPGLSKFTKLMDAFHSGDKDGILKEYKRYSGKQELGRNKTLFDEIQTLGNEYPIFRANGGKIHIKPENRGKFTALKKRTGHSASWFKAYGTPAQKKMAVFALNSRKWKHEDGGPLANYLDDGGPYNVIPLGGDYLTYLQTIPEVSGGAIEPSVATASLPEKFNGSQAAAARYAEGYQKGAKPVSEAMNRAGQDIFRAADTVAGFVPGPIGMIDWLGHMGADAAEGNWGKVGRDVALATALGAGARGIGWLKNYVDDATNFGEDVFRAFTDGVPGSVSTNFTYTAPAARTTMEALLAEPTDLNFFNNKALRLMAGQGNAKAAEELATRPYEIENLGGGYMLKSLMRGNPLEKQISKNGTVNVNNVRSLVGKGSKVEQAVVDKVLASEEFAGKKSIDYNRFRKAVQDELITYERTPNSAYESYGAERIGIVPRDGRETLEAQRAFLRDHPELNWSVASGYDGRFEKTIPTDYGSYIEQLIPEEEVNAMFPGWRNQYAPPRSVTTNTYTFSSPRIPQGSGKHYDANTLGHSRTYTTADEPDVLHVMESQSDWGQGYKKMNLDGEYNQKRINSLERRINNLKESINSEMDGLRTEKMNDGSDMSPWFADSLRKQIEKDKQLLEELTVELDIRRNPKSASQQDYLAENFTSRQIQENLRYAAEKGQTKMRYPTKETAAKIEGYPKETNYYDADGNLVTDSRKIYTIGKENEKELDLIQRELDGYYAKFNVAQLPNGDYVPAGNYSDNPYQQLIEAIPRKQAAYDGWRANHPNATSEKGQRVVDEMKRKAEEIKNFRARVKYLNQRMKELKSIKPYVDPSIKKEVKYMHEDDILRKYNEFPKQFKKLYRGADVRTVTDPNGNTWYEVDVPENYLKQEWVYKNGGRLREFDNISDIF